MRHTRGASLLLAALALVQQTHHANAFCTQPLKLTQAEGHVTLQVPSSGSNATQLNCSLLLLPPDSSQPLVVTFHGLSLPGSSCAAAPPPSPSRLRSRRLRASTSADDDPPLLASSSPSAPSPSLLAPSSGPRSPTGLHPRQLLEYHAGRPVVSDTYLAVHDGLSPLSPLVAVFRCNDSAPVATTYSRLLVELYVQAGETVADFNMSWSPANVVCGDGICNHPGGETVATCPADCTTLSTLPDATPQCRSVDPDATCSYQPYITCPDTHETLTATAGNASRTIEYKHALFGAPVPMAPVRYSLVAARHDSTSCHPWPWSACNAAPHSCDAVCPTNCSAQCVASIANSACSPLDVNLFNGTYVTNATVDTWMEGGDLPPLPAVIAGRFYCPWLDKALAMDALGAQLGIISRADSVSEVSVDQLDFMVAPRDRLDEARSVSMPLLVVNLADSTWLEQQVALGEVILELSPRASRRCLGDEVLTGANGTLASGPTGRDYCGNQRCAWHIHVAAGETIVITFSRFELECTTGVDGPHDSVRIYDGATRHAPLLATLSCNGGGAPEPVFTTTSDALVVFVSDENPDSDNVNYNLHSNYGGFAAAWYTSSEYCATLAGACAPCAAASVCSHCTTDASCALTSAAPPPSCPGGSLVSSALDFTVGSPYGAAPHAELHTCCAANFGGADGLDCAECIPGRYGAACVSACACEVGNCDDGVAGTGACDCVVGTDAWWTDGNVTNPTVCATCGISWELVVGSRCDKGTGIASLISESDNCDGGRLLDSKGREVLSRGNYSWNSHLNYEDIWLRVRAVAADGSAVMMRVGDALVETPLSSAGSDIALANWSALVPASVFNNTIRLGVYRAGRVSACEVALTLYRTPDSQTGYSRWDTYVFVEAPNSINSVGVNTTANGSPLVKDITCPAYHDACQLVELTQPQSLVTFDIQAMERTLDCTLAPHVCAIDTALTVLAEGAYEESALSLTIRDNSWMSTSSIVRDSSPYGHRGQLALVLRMPVGTTAVELQVTAEDGSLAKYALFVRRAASTVSTIGRLSLTGAVVYGSDATQLDETPRDARFVIDIPDDTVPSAVGPPAVYSVGLTVASTHEVGCATMAFPYCKADMPQHTILQQGTIGPAQPLSSAAIEVSDAETYFDVRVFAEDGESSTVYTMHVCCRPCGCEQVLSPPPSPPPPGYPPAAPPPEPPIPPRASTISGSTWLLLLLIASTLLLCIISVCFCIRVQCIRSRRQLAMQGPPGFVRPDPAVVLEALLPFLQEVSVEDAKAEGSGVADESCSICLADLCGAPDVDDPAPEASAPKDPNDEQQQDRPIPELSEPPNATSTRTGADSARSCSCCNAASATAKADEQEPELEPLLMLPCQHIFHAACIKGWISHKGFNSTCPLCKRVISWERQMELARAAGALPPPSAQDIAQQDLEGGAGGEGTELVARPELAADAVAAAGGNPVDETPWMSQLLLQQPPPTEAELTAALQQHVPQNPRELNDALQQHMPQQSPQRQPPGSAAETEMAAFAESQRAAETEMDAVAQSARASRAASARATPRLRPNEMPRPDQAPVEMTGPEIDGVEFSSVGGQQDSRRVPVELASPRNVLTPPSTSGSEPDALPLHDPALQQAPMAQMNLGSSRGSQRASAQPSPRVPPPRAGGASRNASLTTSQRGSQRQTPRAAGGFDGVQDAIQRQGGT